MKKIIKLISIVCLLAMLVGMLPVVGVSAADPATLVISAPEYVKAGKEFTITVSLANNSDFYAINFLLTYDQDAFEFVKDDFTDTLMPAGTGISANQDNGYTFNRANADARYNVSGDGALVKLTFNAKEDVVLGDYTFDTTIDPNNTTKIDSNNKKENITIADTSATIEVVDADTSFTTIDSAQVNLGTDISMIYKVTLDPDHAGATMKFTFHGKEYDVEGKATATANVYTYTLAEIAPQCMGDNIKAELIYGGNVVATKDEYSILAYCENTIAKNAATLEMSDAKYAAMKTLIADMLVYGAKAQLYQNYKTNALVDANVTGATTLSGTAPSSVRQVRASSEDGVELTGIGVHFDSTNSLYVTIKLPENATNIQVRIGNDTVAATMEDFVYNSETSTYYANLGEVSILDYGTSYMINLGFWDADWEEFTSYQKVRYSVNSYINVKWGGDEPTAMNNLARALYNYSKSAVAFQTAE